MSKKVPRAKRRELRDKGVYEPPPRVPRQARETERRADEAAIGARTRSARDEIAVEAEAPSVRVPVAPTRDRTVLVLFGLTALAGFIFWLTQRSPAKSETKIDVSSVPASSVSKP